MSGDPKKTKKSGGGDKTRTISKMEEPTKKDNSADEQADSTSITDDIKGCDYYHGLLPRTDVEPLLVKEGDYLLRKTEHSPGEIVLALSVRGGGDAKGAVKHFMINQDSDGSFYLEKHHEKSISDLIHWHKTTKTPLSATSGIRLRRPVERAIWLLNHDSIVLVKKLGEGAFGEVFQAEYVNGKDKTVVAVKTMRNEVTREARLKFMKEARLMRKYQHKHVVKILGVAVHEHPLMLIMEMCNGGSLVSHLKKSHPDKNEKLRFSVEAADGLAYLEKQACIHRDIAARNCLLNEKKEVKISDFGMSDDRTIVHDDTLDKVPVKWLAPETLQDKIYSLKTDVWSYGILMWEIYSDGAEPYPGLTRLQTRAKIIVHNYRMDVPKDCPPEVGKVMQSCWEKEPAKRPEMSQIYKQLKKLAA